MLGCIQPMSSPMMKMMLGFCCCCAAAGRLATIPAATNASRARHAFPMMFIRTLLTFRLRGGRTIERIEEPRMGLLDCRREQSLRLETRIDHAGLVHVRPLHILRLPARVFPICLSNAPTYRRIACIALLRSLRDRLRAREHHGNERRK